MTVVVAAVIEQDGKFLVARRLSGTRHRRTARVQTTIAITAA